MSETLDYRRRRKQDSERKRLRVLQAAGLCFAELGFRGSSVEQIAHRAGVSKGLVFHFFGSKQALIKAVIEDGLSQWATLSEYRVSGIEDDALSELRVLFVASFDFVEQNPVLLLFNRDEEGLGRHYRQQIARRNRHWRERVQNTLKAGVRRGEVRDIDIKRVADIFHQLQTMLIAQGSLGESPPSYDRKSIDTAIDIFIRGISP